MITIQKVTGNVKTVPRRPPGPGDTGLTPTPSVIPNLTTLSW
jgi:hypothetical protein